MNRQDRRRLRRKAERGELSDHEQRVLAAANRAADRKTRARRALARLEQLHAEPTPETVRRRAKAVLSPAEYQAWALRARGLSFEECGRLAGKSKAAMNSNFRRAAAKLRGEFPRYNSEDS